MRLYLALFLYYLLWVPYFIVVFVKNVGKAFIEKITKP